MTTAIFDTLHYTKKLKSAGLDEKIAEAQAEALAEIFENDVPSKTDIKAIRDDITVLKKEIHADTKAIISELKTDLIKWMFAIGFAFFGLFFSYIKYIH